MRFLRTLILLMLTGCASDNWTRADTGWQVAYTAAVVADAWTTSRIQYTPGIQEDGLIAREVLGDQPGTAETWQYFGTMALSHYLISRALPRKWRRYWQVGGVALHGYDAVRNCDQGLCSDTDPPADIPICPNCQPVK